MNVRNCMSAAAVLGLAALASGPVAFAADKPAKAPAACFSSRNWDGWHSPDQKTIYFRVNVRDIFKVDLSYGSPLLTYSDSHLISREHGTDWICAPIDLDLSVSDGSGIHDPLFVKAITKLTAEQVAAIPKKDLP